MVLQKETITLVPRIVKEEAIKLSAVGYHDKALELLNENKIMVDVYEDRIEMKVSESLGPNRDLDRPLSNIWKRINKIKKAKKEK